MQIQYWCHPLISIHSARVGGDGDILCQPHRYQLFQSTPPVWAETNPGRPSDGELLISIHSTRVGGDIKIAPIMASKSDFNPLHPCGRRLSNTGDNNLVTEISIHSTRVGGDAKSQRAYPAPLISIHSTRVGGDLRPELVCTVKFMISIHSTRVGGDITPARRSSGPSIFQSTPPVWAETNTARVHRPSGQNFNPLHPCGRRRTARSNPTRFPDFNPLHPCGRRPSLSISMVSPPLFQSTPPVWAETRAAGNAPMAELNFNPLHPCGRRHAVRVFLLRDIIISIHSTRVGGDRC